MTTIQKNTNPTVALVTQREEALKKLVGPQINQFMGAIMAELRPVNAQGQPNKLLKCEPGSFYAACHQAAGLRLMPGPLRECSLVPYGKVATLIIEYRGFAALAQRHQDVDVVNWDVVYKGDHFKQDRVRGTIEHERDPDADEAYMADENIVGAWCWVQLTSGREISHYMTMAEINKRRKNTNFWRDWLPEMCVKTVVRKHLNSGKVPRSTELIKAIEHDIQQEKRAEILSEKSEVPVHVVKDVQVGFEEPEDETNDNFGLDEKPNAEKTDRELVLDDITTFAIKLKLKPSQTLDIATEVFGQTVLDIEELSVSEMQKVASEMEMRL